MRNAFKIWLLCTRYISQEIAPSLPMYKLCSLLICASLVPQPVWFAESGPAATSGPAAAFLGSWPSRPSWGRQLSRRLSYSKGRGILGILFYSCISWCLSFACKMTSTWWKLHKTLSAHSFLTQTKHKTASNSQKNPFIAFSTKKGRIWCPITFYST